MNVVVHPALRSSAKKVAGGPVGLVGVIVCLVRIGVVGTLVVVTLTVLVLLALLRAYPAIYRRRASNAGGEGLTAEASSGGHPGVLRITANSVEFSSNKTRQVTRLAKAEISQADLADVRPSFERRERR